MRSSRFTTQDLTWTTLSSTGVCAFIELASTVSKALDIQAAVALDISSASSSGGAANDASPSLGAASLYAFTRFIEPPEEAATAAGVDVYGGTTAMADAIDRSGADGAAAATARVVSPGSDIAWESVLLQPIFRDASDGSHFNTSKSAGVDYAF